MDNYESPVFWKIWGQFAEKLRCESWQTNLDIERSEGRELVRYSFLNIRWHSGVRKWDRLGMHYGDIDAHFEQSPRSNYTLECYVAYFYQIGADSLPNALTRIAKKFPSGLAEAIGSELNLKFHLESLLSKVLFGTLSDYTKKAENRVAVLLILDALVASGSSVAFQLRDDFVTPTASRMNVAR